MLPSNVPSHRHMSPGVTPNGAFHTPASRLAPESLRPFCRRLLLRSLPPSSYLVGGRDCDPPARFEATPTQRCAWPIFCVDLSVCKVCMRWYLLSGLWKECARETGEDDEYTLPDV